MSKRRTVEILDRYKWTHPHKRELRRGLCQLYNSDINFKSLDGLDTRQIKNFKKKYRKRQFKEDSLWKIAKAEELEDPEVPIKPVNYTLHPMHQPRYNQLCSALQHRYLSNPSPTMDARMKKYFRALSILEYEHEQGILTDTEFGPSMVAETCWTPAEKKRFFLGLERCGKNNIPEIARRVGNTKTEAQVYEFQQLLAAAAEGIKANQADFLSAREMSPIYIAQEERMASLIQETLEVESYGKHLNLLERPENELLEIWNLSSLTRMFGKINDMTVLSSATVNLYELTKQFVSDIMVDLHTQLLNSKTKTVSRSLMNVTLAKRNKHILADRRMKHLDIMAMLDKRYEFHEPYTRGKSASYLAKRRRIMTPLDYSDDEEEESISGEEESENLDKYIQVSDDEEDIRWFGEEKSDPPSDEDGLDEMLEPIDDADAIPGIFVTKDEEREHEEAVEADQSLQNTIGVDSSDEEENDDEDEAEEVEMQRLDALHEKQLIDFLGFYDEDAILEANELSKRRKAE